MKVSPAAVADVLVCASERGRDVLVQTDRLLREAFGPEVVQAAHREWTRRLREGVSSGEATPVSISPAAAAPEDGILELVQRIRATTPGGLF